jgi:glycolate oxidase iron-sulfur subunit
MLQESPKLLNCVHCGLCLDECPTYRLSGDENNSPRGRLATWRAISEDRLQPDAVTDFYTEECVGCLACVSACPANVPYGEILMETRAERVRQGYRPDFRLRLMSWLVTRPRLLNLFSLPLRLARRLGWKLHRTQFSGLPAAVEGSAAYATRVNSALRPKGRQVALFTGCVMEAVYREINFATIRVLAANGYQVLAPESQGCCGAIHEHSGLPGKAGLDAQNQAAFASADVVLTNSSGCGLSLSHALPGKQKDLIGFLEAEGVKAGAKLDASHVYYDFPCHSYHGQGLKTPPAGLFKAIQANWSLAPDADRCCGSGGAYQITHEGNARKILEEKSAFLDASPFENPVLATANHVCMMQWSSASTQKPFKVKHLIQLLDESYRKAGFYGSQI